MSNLFPISEIQKSEVGEKNLKVNQDGVTVSPDAGGSGGKLYHHIISIYLDHWDDSKNAGVYVNFQYDFYNSKATTYTREEALNKLFEVMNRCSNTEDTTFPLPTLGLSGVMAYYGADSDEEHDVRKIWNDNDVYTLYWYLNLEDDEKNNWAIPKDEIEDEADVSSHVFEVM